MNTETKISVKDVVAQVRRLAAENPDFVYKKVFFTNSEGNPDYRCQYVKEGKGDCIIGQALVDVGVPVESLAEWDKGIYAATAVVPRFVDVPYDDPAVGWLNAVQGYQDKGRTWQESVYEADLIYYSNV